MRNRAVWAQLRLKQQKARLFEHRLRNRIKGQEPDEMFDEHGLKIEIDTILGRIKLKKGT